VGRVVWSHARLRPDDCRLIKRVTFRAALEREMLVESLPLC
jgi:hypothetical protein